MEGLSLAGNIQGMPADALIILFKTKSISNVIKWVDDFIFFCIPDIHLPLTHSLSNP